jgi:predicted AlkP superfamily pyrophosphatase or phosphodiesterase
MKGFCFVIIVTFLATHLFAQDTAQRVFPGQSNSIAQQQQPYVIMISIDGFRYDYAEKFNAVNLLALSDNGVRATAMQPCFPSLTFPNHYSLATGMYPSHHGLVDNNFYDRKRKQVYKVGNRDAVEDGSWYGGTPLWVLAAQQQMVSASYFWVGSESEIQGVRPTYYFKYQEKTDIDQRIQTVVNWLRLPEAQRPHLITFYFPEVDHAGHNAGPDADTTRKMVQFVDECIGKMVREVAALQLPVNFIIVSDHGMTAADTLHRITIPPQATKDMTVAFGSEKVMLYGNETQIRKSYEYLKQHQEHYTVYLKNETPARWHYGQEDRFNRIGDIVLVAAAGYLFTENMPARKAYPGHHGYDNNLTEMNATFMAWGPAFKPHTRIATFENVNVYPLVAHLLGLQINTPVDGKLEVLQPTLK